MKRFLFVVLCVFTAATAMVKTAGLLEAASMGDCTETNIEQGKKCKNAQPCYLNTDCRLVIASAGGGSSKITDVRDYGGCKDIILPGGSCVNCKKYYCAKKEYYTDLDCMNADNSRGPKLYSKNNACLIQ